MKKVAGFKILVNNDTKVLKKNPNMCHNKTSKFAPLHLAIPDLNFPQQEKVLIGSHSETKFFMLLVVPLRNQSTRSKECVQ